MQLSKLSFCLVTADAEKVVPGGYLAAEVQMYETGSEALMCLKKEAMIIDMLPNFRLKQSK